MVYDLPRHLRGSVMAVEGAPDILYKINKCKYLKSAAGAQGCGLRPQPLSPPHRRSQDRRAICIAPGACAVGDADDSPALRAARPLGSRPLGTPSRRRGCRPP